jgi:hypothetical protein
MSAACSPAAAAPQLAPRRLVNGIRGLFAGEAATSERWTALLASAAPGDETRPRRRDWAYAKRCESETQQLRFHRAGDCSMKIAIPSMHIHDCRHIKVTKDAGTENIQINFDNGVFVIQALARDDVAMPELEIVETETDK